MAADGIDERLMGYAARSGRPGGAAGRTLTVHATDTRGDGTVRVGRQGRLAVTRVRGGPTRPWRGAGRTCTSRSGIGARRQRWQSTATPISWRAGAVTCGSAGAELGAGGRRRDQGRRGESHGANRLLGRPGA